MSLKQSQRGAEATNARDGNSSYNASDTLEYQRSAEQDQKTSTWTSTGSGSWRETASNAGSNEPKDGLRSAIALKLGLVERILPETVSGGLAKLVSNEQVSISKDRPWGPTILRFGPVSGLFCMLLAFASIFASLGVLIGSNGSPVRHWSAPPSTYLAICTAIANLAVRYACIQGVVIAWWNKALRGSSFKQLHYDYRAGTTLGGALTSGRYTGLLGLACLASTLVVVDGPLLQRASTVISAPIDQALPLNLTMAAQIPAEYTGLWQTVNWVGTGYNYSNAFNATMPAPTGKVSNGIWTTIHERIQSKLSKAWYFQKAPLSGVFQGCPGKCTAKLIAPALAATSCSSHQLPIDRHESLPNGVGGTLVPALTDDSFVISVELVVDGDQEKINLVTAYASLEDCRGFLNVTACTLESAIPRSSTLLISTDHKVALTNVDSTQTYANTTVHADSAIKPRILALSNNAAVSSKTVTPIGLHPSTLGGIVALHWSKWDSYNAIWKEHGVPYSWVVDGGAVFTYEHQTKNGECASFSDPTDDMLSELNMLMIYTGMFAAEEDRGFLKARMESKWLDRVQTTITGQEVGHDSVFHTNFHYFTAAAVLELVCIALIAPTYWGWWNLGRHVSFSPLEVAKAFGSPLLSECNSNATGREIACFAGDSSIRYGATRDTGAEKSRLTFADRNSVDPPRKGERFVV